MIYHDDQWKNVREPAPTVRATTRAETQEEIDRDYAEGRITLDNWREITNALSEPSPRIR